MPQSLCKLYVHLIFSTKDRARVLGQESHNNVNAYIGGVLRGLGCPALAVGCAPDHVHILYIQDKTHLLPDVVMHVKKESSKWIKTQGEQFAQFHWQSGYGAFSVSASRVSVVTRYIRDQDKHHAKVSFQDEFRRFLKQYLIHFDERFIWD